MIRDLRISIPGDFVHLSRINAHCSMQHRYMLLKYIAHRTCCLGVTLLQCQGFKMPGGLGPGHGWGQGPPVTFLMAKQR